MGLGKFGTLLVSFLNAAATDPERNPSLMAAAATEKRKGKNLFASVFICMEMSRGGKTCVRREGKRQTRSSSLRLSRFSNSLLSSHHKRAGASE
jgi:hypothetical protein